uniref:FGENESH: predicted gene_2.392 protein n=1 Tax=Rhodotorula toruloides TaxID=5286 RepID=A0A0K3C9P9_RHOTO
MSTAVVTPSKQINPLLAAYLQSLATRPMLTKSLTSGSLSILSEIIAGHVAGSPPPPLPAKERTGILPLDILKQNHKAIKLGLYGFFVSAPLGHSLLAILQKAFAGKTSARAKLGMIVASNLFVSPIQQSVYIAAMAIINGATTPQAIVNAWKMSIWKIMKVRPTVVSLLSRPHKLTSMLQLSWVVSTLSMAFAQKLLAPELWVPFFTLVGQTVGCVINIQVKRRALAARAKSQAAKDAAEALEKKVEKELGPAGEGKSQ